MARLKKELRPERISGGYALIPWVVIDSISFFGASDKAKSLLYALIRQHNGMNNGHLHLSKKWLHEHGWKSPESNMKSCKELITRGILIQTKWGGLNMGPNLYALTWYDITNYVGLDITSKGYQRGAYLLCTMPPTERRKPPVKKQKDHNDDRNRAVTVAETGNKSSVTLVETVKPNLRAITGTAIENNVVIPLHRNSSVRRIVGVKGKSGVAKR